MVHGLVEAFILPMVVISEEIEFETEDETTYVQVALTLKPADEQIKQHLELQDMKARYEKKHPYWGFVNDVIWKALPPDGAITIKIPITENNRIYVFENGDTTFKDAYPVDLVSLAQLLWRAMDLDWSFTGLSNIENEQLHVTFTRISDKYEATGFSDRDGYCQYGFTTIHTDYPSGSFKSLEDKED